MRLSISLPPQGSALRATFDSDFMQQIVHDLSPENRESLPAYFRAVPAVCRMVRESKLRGARCVCYRGNGDVVLVNIGPRGGEKIVWKFGTFGK